MEFAPKFDYDLMEKENKEILKVYEPLYNERKGLKRNLKQLQSKHSKLEANINFTKQVNSLSITD